MAISTQIQNLNLIPGKSAPVVVHLSQGNVGNTVQFYLYDGDNPYYPNGVTIAVHGIRSDGTAFGPYSVSTTSGSNLVSFSIVTAMTSVSGAAIGELVLTDSAQHQIGTANFGMLVEETPYSSSVTYEDDLSIYQRILAYVQSIPAEIKDEVSSLSTSLYQEINNVKSLIGTPLMASSSSSMTDTSKTYVYVGSESGYTYGNWYYYNGSSWVSGGVYNSLAFETDKTLSLSNKAADAKVTGDYINKIRNSLGITDTHSGISVIQGIVNVNGNIYTNSANWYHVDGGVIYGNKYYVTGLSVNSSFPLVVWKNANGVVTGYSTEYSQSNTVYTDVEVTPPTSDTTLISINYDTHYMDVAYMKADNFRNIETYVTSKIDENVRDIKSALSSEYGYVSPTLVWGKGYINGSNGAVVLNSDVNICTPDYFTVSGKTTIGNGHPGNVIVYEYNDDGTFLRSLATLSTGQTTVFTGTKNIKLSMESATRISFGSRVNITTQPYVKLTNGFWNGKSIVWFGTSIPEGASYNEGQLTSYPYPDIVCRNLGAKVWYNESLGSSGVRAGNHNHISTNDPMGYSGVYALPLLYSLSMSTDEKQSLIDNWDSKWSSIVPTGGATIDMSSAAIDKYMNSCWDRKLSKYLSGGSVGQMDLYVFDHGYNDSGYGYDYSDLKSVPSSETDRTYFIGAMNFLINKILTDNPRARICFIGHYENTLHPEISEAQTMLSEKWSYPLCKTWSKLGWSQNVVTVNGQDKTILSIWCPDGIHPSSDVTGQSLAKYAEVVEAFMRNEVR